MTWEIDTTSTPDPILTYDECSVIQGLQAYQALRAIKDEPILRARVVELERKMDPCRWTQEETSAWLSRQHNLQAAFAALREA